MKKVQEKEAGNLRRINSKAPEKDLILEAAGILKSGGAIIFPTLALYGLGANALDSKAVQRVFEIKNRPLNKPLLVLVQNMEGLRALVKSVPEAAEKLMKQFWPGNVTLVFEARDTVCEILCAGTGKIGIR
ncbi:MAG: Sua5/YciO/YrdC/YwlC family protein, partial [Proteobacteria bacterium]|nr:Sua5/YciO/YrdC/YwlC family protein [Pseudomonadota bacterium]